MPVEIYRVIHIFGILLIFTGLAGIWGIHFAKSGKSKTGSLAALHGAGLLLVLVSGFGMAGKLGYMASFPPWLIVKVVVWLILGGSLTLAKRKANWGPALLVGWALLGAIAAYSAILKP